MKEELLRGLSDEQFEKARACKTSEELLQLAMDEGVELNDDQLEAVSGGGCDKTPQSNGGVQNNGVISCPRCYSSNVTRAQTSVIDPTDSAYIAYECLNCSYCW